MTRSDAMNEANVPSETLEQRERDLGEIFDAYFKVMGYRSSEYANREEEFAHELRKTRAVFIRDRIDADSDNKEYDEKIVEQLESYFYSIMISERRMTDEDVLSTRTFADSTFQKRMEFLRSYSNAAKYLSFEYVHELSRLVAEYWSSINPASATLFSKNTTVLFVMNVLALVTAEVGEMTASEVDRFKDIPISWRLTMLGLVPPSDERFKAYPLSELIDDDNEKLDFLTYYNNPLDLMGLLQDEFGDH